MIKLLFVCMGNICRSPSAEAIMKKIVSENNLDDKIFCDSAGTLGYHAGDQPDSRMIAHAKKRNVFLNHAARKITNEDLIEFDHILVMDDDNFSNVMLLNGTESDKSKIKKLADYCVKLDEDEVPDPYYGGAEGFEKVLDILEDACSGLLEDLKIKHNLK
ncbi:MAG: phosphotyrosine protein phosphatase [Chlorobiaceae bacterium]|nr:phosphotyrosine protein phosphatase [Chlorobiaceae bacterium]MBA4309401.1 phosphotyrosine protein phosphatase [Chlorobiaceae bacterium]